MTIVNGVKIKRKPPTRDFYSPCTCGKFKTRMTESTFEIGQVEVCWNCGCHAPKQDKGEE